MATAAAGSSMHLRTSQWTSTQPGVTKIAVSQPMPPVSVGFASSKRAGLRRTNLLQVTSVAKLEASTPPAADDEVIKTEVPATPEPPAPAPVETAASVFLADVANLIKLVDSRDIVELELKHLDYELVIRKKEALPPPPQATYPGNHVQAHTSFIPGYGVPPGQITPPPPPVPVEEVVVKAPPPSVEAPPPKPAGSSYPPMLSPMAGTFYRSPGPGEPAFVKVGDTITKGQVVCIVEAMKLMNEIEADQSGTIVEIVAEDGKPVSIETPLFVIKP